MDGLDPCPTLMQHIRENGYSCGRDNFRRQTGRLAVDHVVQFARWQHSAVERGARFAVPDISLLIRLQHSLELR